MATIHTFYPRSKGHSSSKELYDYRSGIRVLAFDSAYDIMEPHATELEARMMERRLGFGHLWPASRLSAGLMGELRRVGVPFCIVNRVVIMPKDFRVITELEPTEASMARAAAVMEKAA